MDQEFIAHRRGKDGEKQLLWDHLHEVSCLAGEFAAKIGLEKHGQLLGLLHDLGKATFEFYQYIGLEIEKVGSGASSVSSRDMKYNQEFI
jgi:HD superfamily phosphodiesterase